MYKLINCSFARLIIIQLQISLPSLLKFTTKQLERASKKCEKEEKAQQAKVKKVHVVVLASVL